MPSSAAHPPFLLQTPVPDPDPHRYSILSPVTPLILNDRVVARAELTDQSEALAAVWADQGLAAGQLVLCPVAGATADFTVIQAALALKGAALMPLPVGLDLAERRRIASDTGAEWLWEPVPSSGGDGSRPQPQGRLTPTGCAPEDALSQAAAAADPLALIVRTSGSSGAAKAAMLTASAVAASCRHANARLELGAGDLWLCCLPRQHIGGLMISYRCAQAGAHLLLHSGFDVAQVAADLRAHPVSHLSLVPPMLARLLEVLGAPPPWLRVALIGGQALNSTLARRALDAGWPLHLGYGMTETCSFIASARLGTDEAGLIPLSEVRLDCAPCQQGASRLRVRAPTLMCGYANPQRRRGQGLEAAGWFRTDDLACRTRAGGLRIRGRADQSLVIAGVNVLPAEIEARLGHCPDVDECAIIALPDPVWGHTLVAVYRGPVAPDALLAWCRSQLPSPQRPRLCVPLADWPTLASGKRDLPELRAIAQRAWLGQRDGSGKGG